MDFEWDDDKSARNAHERGLPFEVATKLFDNSTLEWDDRRRNYGERRICAIGCIGERCFVCVYTWRRRSPTHHISEEGFAWREPCLP